MNNELENIWWFLLDIGIRKMRVTITKTKQSLHKYSSISSLKATKLNLNCKIILCLRVISPEAILFPSKENTDIILLRINLYIHTFMFMHTYVSSKSFYYR